MTVGRIITAVALASLVCGASAQVPCRFTEVPITVDGVLDEVAWRDAEEIAFLIPVTHDTPLSHTVGRVCWDGQNLYVAFAASDEDLRAERTERDSATYRDDVFEIFVMPASPEADYHNFEINALGTIHDGHYPGPGWGWDCDGIRIGLRRHGSLNDPSDRDEGWRLEVAIPFGSLPTLSAAPSPGDTWRFHLARYDHSDYLPDSPELSSSAPLTAVNFHLPADWVGLRFED